MLMLKHLPKHGNGFGVVTVRIKNRLLFFYPLPMACNETIPHPPLPNQIVEKCFRHDGLWPHQTPLGNYSQTMCVWQFWAVAVCWGRYP